MPKYRKKPVEIEAIQWTGDNLDEIRKFTGTYNFIKKETDSVGIYTLEGKMYASPGDYIIKGVKGECYPCKPDIFVETYEPVEK